jgi:hypothetical protein
MIVWLRHRSLICLLFRMQVLLNNNRYYYLIPLWDLLFSEGWNDSVLVDHCYWSWYSCWGWLLEIRGPHEIHHASILRRGLRLFSLAILEPCLEGGLHLISRRFKLVNGVLMLGYFFGHGDLVPFCGVRFWDWTGAFSILSALANLMLSLICIRCIKRSLREGLLLYSWIMMQTIWTRSAEYFNCIDLMCSSLGLWRVGSITARLINRNPI